MNSNPISNGMISSMAGLNLSSTTPPPGPINGLPPGTQQTSPQPVDVAKEIYPLVLQLANPDMVCILMHALIGSMCSILWRDGHDWHLLGFEREQTKSRYIHNCIALYRRHLNYELSVKDCQICHGKALSKRQ